MKTVWLYNSQFNCEQEYVETEKHPHYPHSILSWTGNSRSVGQLIIPLPPRINYSELACKILQVEQLPDKED